MAETLMVKCSSCGTTFPSPLQMDSRAFDDAQPGDLAKFREEGKDIPEEVVAWHTLRAELTCPSCGETRTYEKSDYSFQTP
jgi:endogenous inhibitor of DNA gyrase (YacG/DUF329 family)